MQKSQRFPFIDALRGFSVILMLFFHFCFDLDYYNLVSIDFDNDHFFYGLPRLIVGLFFFCSGMSLVVAHGPSATAHHWQRFTKKIFLLFFLAIGISAITFTLFPANGIYFGTLHCLSISLLLVAPFRLRPLLLRAIGLFFIILFFLWPRLTLQFPHSAIAAPGFFGYFVDVVSWDYIPLIPWTGFVFLGAAAGHNPKVRGWRYPGVDHFISQRILIPLGQHSLSIYLCHQPLFFGLLWPVAKLWAS